MDESITEELIIDRFGADVLLLFQERRRQHLGLLEGDRDPELAAPRGPLDTQLDDALPELLAGSPLGTTDAVDAVDTAGDLHQCANGLEGGNTAANVVGDGGRPASDGHAAEGRLDTRNLPRRMSSMPVTRA